MIQLNTRGIWGETGTYIHMDNIIYEYFSYQMSNKVVLFSFLQICVSHEVRRIYICRTATESDKELWFAASCMSAFQSLIGVGIF